MKDTVEQLATRVSTGNQNDNAAISAYIKDLDTIEPRFSSGMLGLFEQMGEASKQAELDLTVSIMQGMRMGHTDSSVPMELATQAVMAHSVSTMSFLDNMAKYECGKGDRQLRRIRPDISPDVLGESLDKITRYYQSLATAITILDAALTDQNYKSDIPDFIVWVGTQENPEGTIACAREHKTINTGHLKAILALQSETAAALHTGAI